MKTIFKKKDFKQNSRFLQNFKLKYMAGLYQTYVLDVVEA
jgi:hypothetical protein